MVNLKGLDTRSLILDMTTNLSRVGNYIILDRYDRAEVFLLELEVYLAEVDQRTLDQRFLKWIKKVKKLLIDIRGRKLDSRDLADDAFTCGTLLQNRAIFIYPEDTIKKPS